MSRLIVLAFLATVLVVIATSTGTSPLPAQEPGPLPEVVLPLDEAEVPFEDAPIELPVEILEYEADAGLPFAEETYVPRAAREPPAPVYSFEELHSRIDTLLGELPGQVSVAIFRPGAGVVFSRDEWRPQALASVVKVFILAAYLDRVAREGRFIDEWEHDVLESMIAYSDNYAAEYLWQILGGSQGITAFLSSRGFYDFLPAEDYSWGGAADTPTEIAAFLARLLDGTLLDPDSTGLALSLLGSVWEAQRWGVTAGAAETDPNVTVLLKDGWYPESDGWLVNSAGIVIPSTGTSPYTMVILGQGFALYEDGLDAVQAIAHMANGLMLRPPLLQEHPAYSYLVP